MESNRNLSQGTEGTSSSSSVQSASAASRAKDQVSNAKERAAEIVDQTKQAVSNAYDQTTQTLSEKYGQAIEYGRSNPGTTMLITFGAGVGIGLLLAASLPGRSRMSRISEPIVNALSQVALEFLR